MTHHVSIWRAAQLVGVARGVLQQQVRAGRLAVADDGQVSMDALLQLYPLVRTEDSGLLERVSTIRDEAFGRRVRERLMPSQEVLARRLFAQSQELADVRRHLQRYHGLVLDVQRQIGELCRERPDDVALADLASQARRGLAQALATETAGEWEAMDNMLKLMSAQVKVRPSGHQFSVEGHANLLQAGLQAGLRLNYGCGNGTCGMCKMRVIDGELAAVSHSDYPLSSAERAQGYALMCCHTAASSELTIEVLEAAGAPDIPAQEVLAQVRAVTPLGTDTRLLHLKTLRSQRLRFLAGQSVDIAAPLADAPHAVLPVASCPCDDRNLHFFVARNDDDPLARAVFAGELRAGSTVQVRGPYGDFVLEDGPQPLVFLAADVGFAPIKSLIEHALAREESPSVSLFWLATRSDGHFLANQCRAWSEALDMFEHELLSHPSLTSGARALVDAVRAVVFDWSADFYVAGPSDFVCAVREELAQVGVPSARLRCAIVP